MKKSINETQISTEESDVAFSSGYNAAVSVANSNSVAVAAGNYGSASATGNMCLAIASGIKGAATALNEKSLAIGWGNNTRVKGVLNSYIAAMALDSSGMHIEIRKVDGEKIKPDTWYSLKDGEFLEM